MPNPNVIQIRDDAGNAKYPITDSSLVIEGQSDVHTVLATKIEDVQLPDGTSVVANNVATLPGVYQHNIRFDGDSNTAVFLTIITNFATPFDTPSFIAFINSLSQLGNNAGVVCGGTVRTNSSGIATARAACRLVPGTASTSIGIIYHGTGDAGIAGPIQYSQGSGANGISSLSDSVLSIF